MAGHRDERESLSPDEDRRILLGVDDEFESELVVDDEEEVVVEEATTTTTTTTVEVSEGVHAVANDQLQRVLNRIDDGGGASTHVREQQVMDSPDGGALRFYGRAPARISSQGRPNNPGAAIVSGRMPTAQSPTSGSSAAGAAVLVPMNNSSIRSSNTTTPPGSMSRGAPVVPPGGHQAGGVHFSESVRVSSSALESGGARPFVRLSNSPHYMKHVAAAPTARGNAMRRAAGPNVGPMAGPPGAKRRHHQSFAPMRRHQSHAPGAQQNVRQGTSAATLPEEHHEEHQELLVSSPQHDEPPQQARGASRDDSPEDLQQFLGQGAHYDTLHSQKGEDEPPRHEEMEDLVRVESRLSRMEEEENELLQDYHEGDQLRLSRHSPYEEFEESFAVIVLLGLISVSTGVSESLGENKGAKLQHSLRLAVALFLLFGCFALQWFLLQYISFQMGGGEAAEYYQDAQKILPETSSAMREAMKRGGSLDWRNDETKKENLEKICGWSVANPAVTIGMLIVYLMQLLVELRSAYQLGRWVVTVSETVPDSAEGLAHIEDRPGELVIVGLTRATRWTFFFLVSVPQLIVLFFLLMQGMQFVLATPSSNALDSVINYFIVVQLQMFVYAIAVTRRQKVEISMTMRYLPISERKRDISPAATVRDFLIVLSPVLLAILMYYVALPRLLNRPKLNMQTVSNLCTGFLQEDVYGNHYRWYHMMTIFSPKKGLAMAAGAAAATTGAGAAGAAAGAGAAGAAAGAGTAGAAGGAAGAAGGTAGAGAAGAAGGAAATTGAAVAGGVARTAAGAAAARAAAAAS
ncbi:unnamed protein product [Amoebophrya sp. A25]|nr:unnamed protein product [Amoebophrya sp. A25]|eukprot:GSA25T00015535001.1